MNKRDRLNELKARMAVWDARNPRPTPQMDAFHLGWWAASRDEKLEKLAQSLQIDVEVALRYCPMR